MQNQTNVYSPIHSNDSLNFKIDIKNCNMVLPEGLQSYCVGRYKDIIFLMCGRNNGMHGFSNTTPNFPSNSQNCAFYMIHKGKVFWKSLFNSDLNRKEIDYLSVTSPQSCQINNNLYISGGYGINTKTEKFSTKKMLTIIDLKNLSKWIKNPKCKNLKKRITFIRSSIFQITGGYMTHRKGKFLLVFGQNFDGIYTENADPPTYTQTYSNQIRIFEIKNENTGVKTKAKAKVKIQKYTKKNDDYRRGDLNVLSNPSNDGLIAFSGVFTLNNGIWTLPVLISENGKTKEKTQFKQGVNNYNCASTCLYSKKHKETYYILFGGLTYQFFTNGQLNTDPELPFTNQCVTIKHKNNKFKQYLMDNEYPVILSTTQNVGNFLLFGTSASFIPLKHYKDDVIDYDILRSSKKKQLIGYIIGGIASTLPNTNQSSDSWASTLVFNVYVKF